MNGDILTKVNFEYLLRFHNEQSNLVTMCTKEYQIQVPYGVVQTNNDKFLKITEKPLYKFNVNAGIYVLDPKIIKRIQKGTYVNMTDLLNNYVVKNEKLSVFPIHEYWLDIGDIKEYETAHKDYFNKF